MTTIVEPLSPFTGPLRLGLGFFDHLKASWSPPRRAFGPARRFSAWFGHTSWCPKLLQNRRHDAAHLPGSDHLPTPFPGTIAGLPEGASQHQLVLCRSHQQTPALKLLWSAHMDLGPQRVLLEKAIGMLMRKAVLVAGHDFFQRQRSRLNPDEPTLPWIAPAAFGCRTQHPIDGQLHVTGLSKVQVLPGLDTDGLALLIAAVPTCIRFAPGLWLAALKQLAILARGTSFPHDGRRRLAVQLAIAFEAHECGHLQALASGHTRSGGVPATAGGGQEHYRRELPS